ncbi:MULTISPECIES: ABC transporter permease [Gordonibacter]|uniref:ABC transporter permease n=1 Tax=Gordonibacter faecis TaxID=3047475 RepID=A0ABT7DMJ8_9ACTN|nr:MULTISPECIES: ABC transporter permease [unclassified Gordonibacter]MDJ1650751.1 ABC transporter permease [Gordonibacter sp. KGMB12511]HIW77217.1 ABC transporter permease [Candidatus Gordonibacter avicola]
MRLSHLVRTAVRAVFQNGLRTALTMLGLIIGISSVIILVGIGDGSNQQVQAKMKELGGDALSTYVYQGKLSYDDLAALGQLESLDGAAPSKLFSKKLSAGKAVSNKAFIEATDEHYLHVRNLKLLAGRNLSAVDRENKSKVIVIGTDVATELFGSTDIVGRTVKLDGDEFTVVGVLQNQGESMGLNTGSVALVPFSTAVGMGAGADVDSFYAKARGQERIDEAKAAIGSYLGGEAGIAPGMFDVTSQDEMLRAGNDIDDTMTLLLAGIAAISLVVAGIGVMNVMLVSVTERTREIGIKKALGARRMDILAQFLLEALIMSIVGGAVGIGAGIALGLLLNTVGLTFVVSWNAVWAAVAASTAIGLAFGIFPAHRASRKNPIDALRAE